MVIGAHFFPYRERHHKKQPALDGIHARNPGNVTEEGQVSFVVVVSVRKR
jgi:hypothetical protein